MKFKQSADEIVLAMRKRLHKAKGKWSDLAAMSGVPYSTICKIYQDQSKSPRLHTFVNLSRALDRLESDDKIVLPERATPRPRVGRPSREDALVAASGA